MRAPLVGHNLQETADGTFRFCLRRDTSEGRENPLCCFVGRFVKVAGFTACKAHEKFVFQVDQPLERISGH